MTNRRRVHCNRRPESKKNGKSVQEVSKQLILQPFTLRRKSLIIRQCTRQGSNLQPCDPKSHTLSD
jgi:hypothetical protein